MDSATSLRYALNERKICGAVLTRGKDAAGENQVIAVGKLLFQHGHDAVGFGAIAEFDEDSDDVIECAFTNGLIIGSLESLLETEIGISNQTHGIF